MNELKNKLILADRQYYDLDCYRTQLNNNVLVVGTSGSGKTRSIVTPNLLQAAGSYILSDPKGNLYGKYAPYLRKKGYQVRKLNFADPADPESCGYNFFDYIRSEQDVLKLAHMLVYSSLDSVRAYGGDPFWEDSCELLMTALIGYLWAHAPRKDRSLVKLLEMAQDCRADENGRTMLEPPPTDLLFDRLERKEPDSFALSSYRKFQLATSKTLRSILITLAAKLGRFNTAAIRKLTSADGTDIPRIGREKTALFVVVSDTDRSMDVLANIFFTQAMAELCREADGLPDARLPLDVRFILDDFATNVRIADFPRMIASIRSRGISAMLMVQAESQLTASYGSEGQTIIGNCDSYVYLGGNDVDTAASVARRADVPLSRILAMPVGTNWVFRRGQPPVQSRNFDLEPFLARLRLKEPEKGGREPAA